MENKFKKGLILGGLLMVVAAVACAMSKKGREFTEELKEDLEPMARHLSKNLKRLRNTAKDDFEELVTTLVEEYAKNKEMSIGLKNKLMNELKSKWYEIEEEYLNQKS
jgi:hypothetical protein